MKILFSPSETKSRLQKDIPINSSAFSFPKLYDKRLEMLKIYTEYIQNLSKEELKIFFGIKNDNEVNWYLNNNIFSSLTCKAIQRYTGVAYDYLDFTSLKQKEQKWVEDNVLIFSNLFGPTLAKDRLPIYRYKQGSTMGAIKPEKFYKENFSEALDIFLQDELILDLRAGFYDKFYTIKQEYITMKFIKNGKVVSHWAKAYRGKILRALASMQPKEKSDFEKIVFDGLQIEEIIQSKNKNLYIFSISA